MMKPPVQFLIIMAVGLLALLVLVQPVAAQDTPELQPGSAITEAPLAIFTEANPRSTRLAVVEIGESVTVLAVDGRWAQVQYGDVTGWAQHVMSGIHFLVNATGDRPVGREFSQMIYDVESDRFVLFGGQGAAARFNDTWAYELATDTWTKMKPAQPPPIGEGPLAYDAQSDRAIWFFGSVWIGSNEGMVDNLTSETWAYDLNSDTWTNMSPATNPPPLIGTRMVYDSESDRMILFGGMDPSSWGELKPVYLNETWAYDYDTNIWTPMNPAVSPPGMYFQPMGYDAIADRVVMTGSNANEITLDTWLYDYNTNTWEARTTAEVPQVRDWSTMVYAAETDRLILFGGYGANVMNDTWNYDCIANSWTEVTPTTSPSSRSGHAMAYSSAADQVVLFGGWSTFENTYTADTWTFDANTNTWAEVSQ